ncbi:hypothetical protein U1Q18_014082 [Sarracenia purpurea var. burkii]
MSSSEAGSFTTTSSNQSNNLLKSDDPRQRMSYQGDGVGRRGEGKQGSEGYDGSGGFDLRLREAAEGNVLYGGDAGKTFLLEAGVVIS